MYNVFRICFRMCYFAQNLPSMQSINPYTGKVIASYNAHTNEEVDKTLYKMSLRFQQWKQVDFEHKATLIDNLGRLLLKQKDLLASIITLEMGKPIQESLSEIEKCARLCRHHSSWEALGLSPESISTEATYSGVQYDPIGIIFAIMPWNFPFWQVFRFAVPTIMAGNLALLKHAPNVSGCALKIEELFIEAGFPEYVFKSIIVDVSQTENVIAHKQVKGVTITGSARAGRAVAAKAGHHLKKVVLELGGSDPLIVFADADLADCCVCAINSRMLNAGQVCIAAKRFLVQESVFDLFVSQLKIGYESLLLGDPALESVQIGPMARPDLCDEIERQVDESVAMGAKVITGGKRWDENDAFYLPTLLVNIHRNMPVFREETFGPVAIAMPFKTKEEALALANDTDFGLGASVWTKNTDTQKWMADRLEAGSVFVNSTTKSDPRLPFGGTKQSGFGRELSPFGVKEFMNIKTVWFQ